MANLQKWGDVSTWTDGAFNTSSSDLNIGSFVTGYGVLGSGVISNSGLDLYMDVSFQCTSISPGTNPFFALYLLPLLADGSTYADGCHRIDGSQPADSIVSRRHCDFAHRSVDGAERNVP